MKKLKWTSQDAREWRQAANKRYAFAHNLIAPLAAPITSAGLSIVRGLIGSKIDTIILKRLSRRMNCNMESAFNDYELREGDVVASAYVKAGTNWVMYICLQLAHLGEAEFDHLQDVMPWPDAAEPRYWLSLEDDAPRNSPTGHRVIKSHLSDHQIPNLNDSKLIAVTRDPKDCAASAYHYFRTIVLGPTMPPPDVWLEHFMSNDPVFGRWDEFTASWYKKRKQKNILFLRFEEIKADPAKAVDQIAAFLEIKLNHNLRERVLKASDFKNMQAINDRFYPVRQSIWTDPDGKIIRKGQVGGASNLFSPLALTRFDKQMSDGLLKLGSDFPYDKIYGAKAEQNRS